MYACLFLCESKRVKLGIFLIRWWNKCVALINHEVSLEYDRKRTLLCCFRPWGHYAAEKAHLKRMVVAMCVCMYVCICLYQC